MPKFTSRVQGYSSRVPHWLCEHCGTLFTHKRPAVCTSCRESIDKPVYFPSKKEYNRYAELKLLDRAGYIDKGTLELQPAYPLHIGEKTFRCTFDFRYTKHGKEVVEDVKTSGTNTDLSKIKRALAEAEHGIKVILV